MTHTTSVAMIRTVALLALIASASAIWPWPESESEPTLWKKGFSQGFPISHGLPQTLVQAIKEGWVLVEGPATTSGFSDLQLYVKPSDPTTCLYFEENQNYVAGLLVAIPEDKITPYYNPTEQGLIPWTYTTDGETKTYLTSSIYFVSEDKSTRTYDANELIQAKDVTFVSTDGEMVKGPKNLTDIENTASSIWTEQNCVILMGLHYYYNMTTSTTCETPFATFFLLYDRDTKQLIGVGFMILGKCTGCSSYEDPNDTVVKMIVNSGPECLYELVKKFGATTHHFHFVDKSYLITCKD